MSTRTPDAIHLLCIQIGERLYGPDFLTNPMQVSFDGLFAMPYTRKSVIFGHDDESLAHIPYGVVLETETAQFIVLRGTEMPKNSWVEWLDDFDAVLEECPLNSGAKWHRGFARLYQTLCTEAGEPLSTVFDPGKTNIVGGHSLGGPLATYTAYAGNAERLCLTACPKPGDTIFATAVNLAVKSISSIANPDDVVPQVPLTVDWPCKMEDFQPIMKPDILAPNLVKPPLPSDWASAHNLGNYEALLKAWLHEYA